MKEDLGWIGVDFDKTLAYYESHTFPDLGLPIDMMVNRVREWLRQGREVRIFTARVAHDGTAKRMLEASRQHRAIEDWCMKHIGCVIPVTNVKDWRMDELWDDRAVQVLPNLGIALQDRVDSLEHQVVYLTKRANGLAGVLDTRPAQVHRDIGPPIGRAS